VVVRDWYVINSYHVSETGACNRCGATIPGRFDGPVGRWGARRLPVTIPKAKTA
jgi:pyruvate formate lyase activating enzyme